MKSTTGHIAASLATQMIVVPIILTLGMFIINDTQFFGGSDDVGKFKILLIAFWGSLLVGSFTGFIFTKLSTDRPDSAKVRYLTPLIPIIYALIFGILLMIMSKGDLNSGWWAVYVFKNPVFMVFDFVLLLSGLHLIVPVAELMGYIGFAIGIYLFDLSYEQLIKNKVARQLQGCFAVLLIIVITFCGNITKDIINFGIIELRYGKLSVGSDITEVDLLAMAPFKKDNGLAKLDKPASLQFTDIETMPRLDGATAAYPVYAAFVEAVYKGLGEYYLTNVGNTSKDTYTAFVASEDYPLNIVKCSKTGTAYERLMTGETDVIFVAEPSKAHLEAIKGKGDDFILTPIGSEAFVFFTNAQSSVENLSIKQIRAIYSGEVTNWKKVGGENKPILAYQRPENSGSQTVMQNAVMKDIKMVEPTTESYAGGMGDIISKVASYKNAKNAIGYSFLYYSSEMVKNNQIKYIAIEGIKPTRETIKNKTYPFSVPVYAVTLKSNKNENVKKFIEWVTSEEGQSLVEKTGYISLY